MQFVVSIMRFSISKISSKSSLSNKNLNYLPTEGSISIKVFKTVTPGVFNEGCTHNRGEI